MRNLKAIAKKVNRLFTAADMKMADSENNPPALQPATFTWYTRWYVSRHTLTYTRAHVPEAGDFHPARSRSSVLYGPFVTGLPSPLYSQRREFDVVFAIRIRRERRRRV